jgi:hypothetical protein
MKLLSHSSIIKLGALVVEPETLASNGDVAWDVVHLVEEVALI